MTRYVVAVFILAALAIGVAFQAAMLLGTVTVGCCRLARVELAVWRNYAAAFLIGSLAKWIRDVAAIVRFATGRRKR